MQPQVGDPGDNPFFRADLAAGSVVRDREHSASFGSTQSAHSAGVGPPGDVRDRGASFSGDQRELSTNPFQMGAGTPYRWVKTVSVVCLTQLCLVRPASTAIISASQFTLRHSAIPSSPSTVQNRRISSRAALPASTHLALDRLALHLRPGACRPAVIHRMATRKITTGYVSRTAPSTA